MPTPERLKPSFGSIRAPELDPILDSTPDPITPDPVEEARKRLIVALDVPDTPSAAELVRRLEHTCQWFKVGMELFTAAGPPVIELLIARGHSVFLDLKFCDIPNTVAGAVRSAAGLGVHMLNVHASGGPAMLEAAQSVLSGLNNPPQLLAVTLLTSMDQAQAKAVGWERPPAEQVELLARMSIAAGIRGFVCSAQEVSTLRGLTGPEGVLVTPGIRPAGAEIGDQKRLATPADALRNGASYLVVGRPITQASDPAAAAEAILEEMAQAI
jgi:orotidine-5'-phosphate decarboxylase